MLKILNFEQDAKQMQEEIDFAHLKFLCKLEDNLKNKYIIIEKKAYRVRSVRENAYGYGTAIMLKYKDKKEEKEAMFPAYKDIQVFDTWEEAQLYIESTN